MLLNVVLCDACGHIALSGHRCRERFQRLLSPPNPRLVPPPAWTRRPVPEAFRGCLERPQRAWAPDNDDELLAMYGDPFADTED
jgi:hypothetical protein